MEQLLLFHFLTRFKKLIHYMNKIILADDHSFIRVGLIQILSDEYPTVEITEVSDGESLINEVSKNDFDLVISDLDMPGRSGLEIITTSIKPRTTNIIAVSVNFVGLSAPLIVTVSRICCNEF